MGSYMTQPRKYSDTGFAARQPIATHEIRGADGVRLHVREWGRPDGPDLVLIHGWSQSELCWTKQINSPLADEFHIVTFDLAVMACRKSRPRPSTTATASCGPMTSRQSSSGRARQADRRRLVLWRLRDLRLSVCLR